MNSTKGALSKGQTLGDADLGEMEDEEGEGNKCWEPQSYLEFSRGRSRKTLPTRVGQHPQDPSAAHHPRVECVWGSYYLQISNWGASREASGWRAQIWHTSQAGPSKSPPQPGTPHFIHPRPAGGKGEAASREDRRPERAHRSALCRLQAMRCT